MAWRFGVRVKLLGRERESEREECLDVALW